MDQADDRDCSYCEPSLRMSRPSCTDLLDTALFPELASHLPSKAASRQLARYIEAQIVGTSHCRGCQASSVRALFHGNRQPPISLEHYIFRIAKYTKCSAVCWLMVLCYFRRLQQRDRSCVLCPFSVHRLLLVSVMVAAKFCDDRYFNNAHYGKVGGIPVAELNMLELDLLSLLDFRTAVPRHELWLQVKAVRAVRSGRVPAAGMCKQASSQTEVASAFEALAISRQPEDAVMVR